MPTTYVLCFSNSNDPFELEVPTSWRDVSTERFLHLQTDTNEETPLLSVLTALTPEQVGQLSADDSKYIVNALDFIQDHAPLMQLPPAKDLPTIGESSYGKLMQAEQYIAQTPNRPGFGAAAFMVALYSLPDNADPVQLAQRYQWTLQQPVTETYPAMVFIWAAWQTFKKATPPTPKTK